MKNSENFDEVIFENRNKDYGAFYHRASYKKFLTRSLMISSAIALLTASIPFLSYKKATSGTERKRIIIYVTDTLISPTKNDELPDLPVQEKQQETTAPEENLRNVLVSNDVADVVIDNFPDADKIENTNVPYSGDFIEVNIDTFKQNIIDNLTEDFVPLPPIMPTFKGGEEEMQKFILKNIIYPDDAIRFGITGTVYISFTVEADGSLSSISLKRGIGSGCDEEAIRVTKLMPKWEPGIQNGRKVRVPMILPIKFYLK